MKKILSILLFALIGHFSYGQNYTPQESNKRSIYLMPVRVDSVASSAYKRVITRYLNGAYGTIVSASTYTTNGEERVMVSRTSNTTITLGSKDCVQGKAIIIQDIAGTRGIANYIQIASSSGNVDGGAYIRIETGGAGVTLNFDGTNWNTTNGTAGTVTGTGTTNQHAKFTSSTAIGNSIASDDGSKMTVAGGADAFLVTSTGSGVTSQLEQTSNNDVLHRFKRNGGNYWDNRYYYTGEALKFNYNDTPVLTLNTSGAATLAGALTVGSTTASTSTSTGSATFGGGIGVAGALNVGLASTFASSVTVGSGANVGYTFQTNGTSYFSGQATFGGAIVINAGINSAADIDFKYLGGTYGRMFTSGNWLFRSSGIFTDIPSSKLTVESTTQGTIPAPKMTTTQRNAISSPTAGLQIFNTTTNTLQSYNGSAWGEVGRVQNGTLSVNGMAAGATTDTTVVVNAGVLKKVLRSTQVDYAAWSGTDTWDGSAPSGTETHLYGYKVEGKTVTGWIRLEYSSVGATNTYVDIELSAFPTPSIPAYVGSGELAFAANGFLATSNTSNPVASRAWLYESSGALKLKILAASNGYQFAMATFTYQIP